MRMRITVLIALVIGAFAACKKGSDVPPLQELHYRMYDSTYNSRTGHYPFEHYDTVQVAIHRVDTIWSDIAAATPFIIYRTDTFRKDTVTGYYRGKALHTPGQFFQLWFTGDSIFTENIIDHHINHAASGYTRGFKVH